MNLLLDTHIFLWLLTDDQRLPRSWQTAIRNPDNRVYLSSVSVWECIVKFSLGKLPLPEPPQLYLPRQRVAHGIASLALDEASAAQLATLPSLHRDPFDRMLLCQALQHNLVLVSRDESIRAYPIPQLDTP